jgi:hypothetical protein
VVVPDVLSGHDHRDSRRVGLTPTATVADDIRQSHPASARSRRDHPSWRRRRHQRDQRVEWRCGGFEAYASWNRQGSIAPRPFRTWMYAVCDSAATSFRVECVTKTVGLAAE